MRWEKVVRSHVASACAASDRGAILLRASLAALGAACELEEIIHLLAVLVVVLIACLAPSGYSWLVELDVPDFAVPRDWSVRAHSLLAEADYTDAIVHLSREHVLIRTRRKTKDCRRKV